MDSATQFVLGAAIGEAVLNKTDSDAASSKAFGLGAALLGGLIGTLPDLDVLFRRFLTGPQALGFHRGVTHSIFFCTLATPILAWVLSYLFRRYRVSWRDWNLFVWLGLNTHWMIDSLTTYGTQVFLPFTNFPVNIGSVFIIDPLYTTPLAIGLFWTLWFSRGGRPYRSQGVRVGLLLSSAYLVLTLGSKYAVMQRFQASLAEERIPYQHLITVPTPFNSVLWYAYADDGDNVWVADSSLLDPSSRRIEWQRIPKNKDRFPGFGEGVADRRLLWFSRGFYRLDQSDGIPVFIDLRFSRLKSWLLPIAPEGDDYLFRWALNPADSLGPYHDFHRLRPVGGLGQVPWRLIWRRILGQPIQETTRNLSGLSTLIKYDGHLG